MSKHHYTGKEVQAMMQADLYRGNGGPEIIVLFCWHIGMGCVLVNCLI